MENNIDSKSEKYKLIHQEAYVGEVPLRFLAKMIARDIVQGKVFLNTPNITVRSPLLPENKANQQTQESSVLAREESNL